MATLTVNLPDYISVKSYKKISYLEHLDGLDKMIKTITYLSDLQEEKVREFSQSDVARMYTDITDKMLDVVPEFYPIFKLGDTLYGYNPISKMNAGEYADLQNLLNAPMENLEEILALLYRPIESNRFHTLEWAIKKGYAVGKGEAENLFKFYDVEKYDSTSRKSRAKVMEDFPVSFAMGTLSFFLEVGRISIENFQASSLSKKEVKEMIQKLKKTHIAPIGVGLSLLTNLQRVPSLQSQEILELQI